MADEQPAGGDPNEIVYVTNPEMGKRGGVPRSKLDAFLAAGYRLETPGESQNVQLEREYGDSPIQAGLEGAARTLTFGGSDVALSALDEEGVRERRDRNAGAAMVGEVGGAVLGGGLGLGGAVTGAGRAAEAATLAKTSGGLGAKLLAGGARGAVEGAAYGAGMGVSEVALSKDPVSWESAAATIGSNALGGAVLGGGIGVGAKLLEEGAVAAKGLATRQVDALRAPETTVDRGAFPEIAGMDKKAAREAIVTEREAVRSQRAADLVEGKAARDAEVAALEKGKDAAAAELHSEALAYKDFLRNEESAFIKTADSEAASVLKRSKVQIMKGLDNAEGFIKRRGTESVIDGLQKQKGALEKVLSDADEVMFNADIERQAMLNRLPEAVPGKNVYLNPEQAKLYRDFIGEGAEAATGKPQSFSEFMKGKMGPAMKEYGGHGPAMKALSEQYQAYKAAFTGGGSPAMAIAGEDLAMFRAAIEDGTVNPPALQRVLNAQELLQRNQALLDKFAALRAPVASDTLAGIDARLEAARAGVNKTPRLEALEAHLADLSEASLGKRIAQGAGALAGGGAGFSVGGPLGAAAGGMVGRELGERLYDRLIRKISTGNAMRAKSIAGNVASFFATGAEKGAKLATKAAPLASRILPAVKYAQKDYVDGVLGPANEKESKSALVNHFRERARELNALTERGPDGSYSVRMQAREMLNARLQALWAVDPDFGNGVEMTHNKRVEFLASKLPRDPAPPHLQVGPSDWEPSHAQMAKFARYMEAVEQPERIVQRMSAGTMTPEDAEVLKSVYPALYGDIRRQLEEHIAEVRVKLPYQKRLALSIYLDTAVDPAVTPEAITVYQGLYAQQQQAQPAPPLKQFKTSEKPTQAQRAAEG